MWIFLFVISIIATSPPDKWCQNDGVFCLNFLTFVLLWLFFKTFQCHFRRCFPNFHFWSILDVILTSRKMSFRSCFACSEAKFTIKGCNSKFLAVLKLLIPFYDFWYFLWQHTKKNPPNHKKASIVRKGWRYNRSL